MRKRSLQTVSKLRRIHAFLVKTPVRTAIGDLDVLVRQLAERIEELETHGVRIESRGRAARSATGALYAALSVARNEHMRPVSRAARIVFPKGSEMRDSFKVSRKVRRPRQVSETLRAMATLADTCKSDFMRVGFAEDFTDRMRAAADAVEAALDRRGTHVAQRAGATVGSITVAQDGRALLQLLDSMVAPRLERTPDLQGEWESLLRQGRRRRHAASRSPEESQFQGE